MEGGDESPIIARLNKQKLEAVQAQNRFKQNKPVDWEKKVTELRNRERDLNAAATIAKWKFGQLPEGDLITTNPIFKAVEKAIDAAYKEKIATKEEIVERDAKVAVSKFTAETKFGDKEIDVAAQHLFNILVAHPEAGEVLDTLIALWDDKVEKDAAKAKSDEEAADAEADAGGEFGDEIGRAHV